MGRRPLRIATGTLLWLLLGSGIGDTTRVTRRASKRKTLIREIPVLKDQLTTHCNNTLQGRSLIADSEGFVCEREKLSSETRCCAGGEQFSCKTCNLENLCCSEYEQCVSCCLSPQYDAAGEMLQQFRAAEREETGYWPSPFEYCRGKCRTTSRSTVHENAYLSPLHHCFSHSGKPTVPSPPVPDVPAGTRVLTSAAGQSCSGRCEAEGLVCAPERFAALNDCNRLRESFACEAGCEAGDGQDLPAYVIPAAPKPQRPSICLIWSKELTGGEMGCGGAGAVRQRSCPCVAAA